LVSAALVILIRSDSRIPFRALARICFVSNDFDAAAGDVASFEADVESRRCRCDALSDDFRARFLASLSPTPLLTVEMDLLTYSRLGVGFSPLSSRCLRAA
jgi:hypothetical protein